MEPTGTPFNNAVWHALTGPQRTVAERHATAVRFPAEMAPFAAVPDAPTADDWYALHTLVGPGGIAVLFRDRVDTPERWGVELRLPCLQMVAGRDEPAVDVGAVRLGTADVPEMLDLVERTEPGPFGSRTIELGTYLGVRHGGALIAMAGERLHCEAWREVSAVCTDPGHRGRGLAAALVRALVTDIHDRGERAFLQVKTDNDSAIRLYDALGFTVCGSAEAVMLRAPR